MKSVAMGLVLGLAGAAWAGPTAHVGKELTKGVTEQVTQEVKGADLEKGAKDVTKGVVEGISGHGKTLQNGANQIGHELVRGMVSELREQSRCSDASKGECLDALVQRYAYASARAAARGAADGAPPWPSMLLAASGFAAGLLAATLTALLLGQRRSRREAGALRPQPA